MDNLFAYMVRLQRDVENVTPSLQVNHSRVRFICFNKSLSSVVTRTGTWKKGVGKEKERTDSKGGERRHQGRAGRLFQSLQRPVVAAGTTGSVVAPAQLGLQLLGSGHGRFHLASTKKCHSSVGFVPTSATAGLFGCPSLISTSS